MDNKFPIDERDSTVNNVKQVQNVVLRILKIVMDICTKHDIPYWLDYGTLLGAVRHKGFIPWDNEADIGMLRDDFNRFSELVRLELPEDIFFQTKETDPLFISSSTYIEAKLRDKYSNYPEFAISHPQFKWHNGIQVDIFVYDVVNLDGEVCVLNAFEKTLTGCRSFFLIQEIEDLIETDFEDAKFLIPAGYDEYLKRNYNNYMKLPPIERRVFEHADVFNPCDHSEILYWPFKK